MSGIPKNHESLYFDTLNRKHKGETVLSLIHATYHAQKAKVDENNIKKEIAQRLEYAYRLYRDNVKGADNGAGSYHGEISQFESQYTIGHEVGIWVNSKLDLSPLAIKVATNMITIREYFDIVFLNYFQPVNNRVVHMLYKLLQYLINNNTNEVDKKDLPGVYGFNMDKDKINAACSFMEVTTYFDYDGKVLKYVGGYSKEELLSYCNTRYVCDNGYNKALQEINTDQKYVQYITTDTRKNNKEFDSKLSDIGNNEIIKLPYNRIIFGAPGTGKSYRINKNKKVFEERYERVTFHPNYSYGQFVGTYKPVPSVDNDGKDSITYTYVPGPFMRTYVKAIKAKETDSKPYLLIIEEINRANVAAVFGDVFQLLDRKNGESEYSIETSEDIRKYLANRLFNKKYEDCLPNEKEQCDCMKIPSNMYIWATMNSADQGVYPMDTAFKRRWSFEYIGINKEEHEMTNVNALLPNTEQIVNWNRLRHAINDQLSRNQIQNINEDKLLGPYFLSNEIIKEKLDDPDHMVKDNDRFLQEFKSKVLMYLFEDVCKQHKNIIFNDNEHDIKRYSSICDTFDKEGLGVFVDGISTLFKADKDSLIPKEKQESNEKKDESFKSE